MERKGGKICFYCTCLRETQRAGQERELTHTFPLSHEDVEDEWVASSLDLFRSITAPRASAALRDIGTATN